MKYVVTIGDRELEIKVLPGEDGVFELMVDGARSFRARSKA